MQEVYLYISVHDCHLDKDMHKQFRMLLYRITKLRAQKKWSIQMAVRVCALSYLYIDMDGY